MPNISRLALMDIQIGGEYIKKYISIYHALISREEENEENEA